MATSTPGRTWNLGGCLVFAVLVMGVLGVLFAEVSDKKALAGASQCGKRQSQILGALVSYAASEGIGGFFPKDLSVDPRSGGAERGRKMTVRIMELVAVAQSLPSQLFKCPSASVGGPQGKLKPDPANPSSAWGWGDGYGVGYAFDWAVPGDPGSDRVVCADRETRTNHNGFVMVTFGDSHVKRFKLLDVSERPAGTLITEGVIAPSTTTGTGIQPDDDIYSTEGDAGDPLTPGKGDPLRAWVK